MADSSSDTSTPEAQSDSGDAEAREQDCPVPSDVPPTWVSLSIRIISVVLVVGLVAFMGYKALSADQPPTFTFAVIEKDVRHVDGVYATPVEVTNQGSGGVSVLVFEARQAGGEPIPLELRVLGPGQTQPVSVWLPADPRQTPPRFSVVSYVK